MEMRGEQITESENPYECLKGIPHSMEYVKLLKETSLSFLLNYLYNLMGRNYSWERRRLDLNPDYRNILLEYMGSMGTLPSLP